MASIYLSGTRQALPLSYLTVYFSLAYTMNHTTTDLASQRSSYEIQCVRYSKIKNDHTAVVFFGQIHARVVNPGFE